MGLFDKFRNTVKTWLLGDEAFIGVQEHVDFVQLRRDYRRGIQKQQLKVKINQADDNVYMNFIKKIVDCSVSLLFGRGIEFDLPGGDDVQIGEKKEKRTPKEQEWLDTVWELNNKSILLHKCAMAACESGTGFIKIIPGGRVGRDETIYPRLQFQDPMLVMMDTEERDFESVIRYTIRYIVVDRITGKEKGIKQVIELREDAGWWILDYESTSGKWELINEEKWEWEFPPLIHWQNLPSLDTPEGEPDITDDIIVLQDRINFNCSNINKILRFHAHPLRYGIDLGKPDKESLGPDQMLLFSSAQKFNQQVGGGKLGNLEMQSDLVGAMGYLGLLIRTIFNNTRTVDISSITEKLGQLTNFQVEVIYQDALDKLATKRELYGDALLELNRRLLTIGGFNDTDPGVIVWPEVLPIDETEEVKLLEFDLGNKLASKNTVQVKRKYDPEQENEKIAQEQEQEVSLGEVLLRGFQGGK